MAEVIPGLLKTGRILPVRRWTSGIGSNGGGFFSDSGLGRGGGVQELVAVAIVGDFHENTQFRRFLKRR